MHESQHSRPLPAAFLVAGATPVLLLAIPLAFADIGIGFLVLVFGAAIAIPAMLLFGVPFVLILRKTRRLSAPYVLVGSAFAGGVGLAVFGYNFNYFPTAGELAGTWAVQAGLRGLLPGAVCGLVAGTAFCLMAGVGQFRRERT